MTIKLQVLLVEDNSEDLKIFLRDLPAVFQESGVDVEIYGCDNFDEAFKLAADPLRRYDMIISDTYKGPYENRDAEVLEIVTSYKRKGKFCPIVICSSYTCPAEFKPGPFTKWADKGPAGEVEQAIKELLKTNVPQAARRLHSDIDHVAGSFLWGFLEEHWDELNADGPLDSEIIERIIRKRAALQIGDLEPSREGIKALEKRNGFEYYIYPTISGETFNLGDIIRCKEDSSDFRVILAPHCYLKVQNGQDVPRANYVLTVRAVAATEVLGEKFENAKEMDPTARHKKLGHWADSPAQTSGKPSGRHWFLPGFLDIPYSFCDFLQLASIPYTDLKDKYNVVATLCPPYAEAIQACFLSFYGSVGLPDIIPSSIENMLE